MTDPWLTAGEGEQVHFAKVISRGQQGSVMWPAHGIDVCTVCSIWPDSWERRKNICPKFCLTQKWLSWCCTRGKWKLTFCQPTESVKAESAGGSGPLHVTHGVHVGHMFTTGCLPWKSFHSCVNELKIPLLQQKWLEFGFCSRDSALREVKWQRTHRRGFRSLLSWWRGNGCLWTSPRVWWSWSGPEETWLYVALTAQRSHSSDFSSAVFNAH